MATKALILDFGGVIALIKGLYYVPVFPDDEMWRKAEKGEVSEGEFWQKLEKYHGKSTEELIEMLLEERKLNQPVVDFLKSIKGKLKMVTINNGLFKVMERMVKEWGLSEVFDVILNSSQEKLSKPDSKIFLLACERLGVKPEECVYVAKKESYLEVAQSLNMKGFVYSNPADFKEQILNLTGLMV